VGLAWCDRQESQRVQPLTLREKSAAFRARVEITGFVEMKRVPDASERGDEHFF
jgi:hypothetical protein